jgi:hypothetical protein
LLSLVNEPIHISDARASIRANRTDALRIHSWAVRAKAVIARHVDAAVAVTAHTIGAARELAFAVAPIRPTRRRIGRWRTEASHVIAVRVTARAEAESSAAVVGSIGSYAAGCAGDRSREWSQRRR